MLAVALGTTVYLWNADSGQIIELTSTVDAVHTHVRTRTNMVDAVRTRGRRRLSKS
jgi:hypothetical protein